MTPLEASEAHGTLAELDRINAARPDCPTCGGRSVVDDPSNCWHGKPCPDCIDGKVPVAQLAATWRAVHQRPDCDVLQSHSAVSLLDHLRDVRP